MSRLDDFERVKSNTGYSVYSERPPEVMEAVKAKRDLLLLKWGLIGLGVVTLGILLTVVPGGIMWPILAIILACGVILGIVFGLAELIWRVGQWKKEKKEILKRARAYGVRDE